MAGSFRDTFSTGTLSAPDESGDQFRDVEYGTGIYKGAQFVMEQGGLPRTHSWGLNIAHQYKRLLAPFDTNEFDDENDPGSVELLLDPEALPDLVAFNNFNGMRTRVGVSPLYGAWAVGVPLYCRAGGIHPPDPSDGDVGFEDITDALVWMLVGGLNHIENEDDETVNDSLTVLLMGACQEEGYFGPFVDYSPIPDDGDNPDFAFQVGLLYSTHPLGSLPATPEAPDFGDFFGNFIEIDPMPSGTMDHPCEYTVYSTRHPRMSIKDLETGALTTYTFPQITIPNIVNLTSAGLSGSKFADKPDWGFWLFEQVPSNGGPRWGVF